MRITFLGDPHGKFKQLRVVWERYCPHHRVISVGDVGVWGNKDEIQPQNFPNNFYFIAGNHDNPSACEKYRPNYLGRFGFVKDLNLFFVSGAMSIDANLRIPFKSWWPDEELNWQEAQKVVELYNKVKPRYVVTHDCPVEVAKILVGEVYKNPTQKLFDCLFINHKPEIWLFGHYHQSFDQTILGTRFICLNELEEKTLDLNPSFIYNT